MIGYLEEADEAWTDADYEPLKQTITRVCTEYLKHFLPSQLALITSFRDLLSVESNVFKVIYYGFCFYSRDYYNVED